MKKFICCVAALSALIFSSGCGDDEKQVEPVDEYWIEWKNESDYRIDFFYVEGGYRWHDGINRGKYVSVRVSGSPEGLSDYIEGRETFVWYEQFVVGGETYAYMENYDPSGAGNSAVPKGLQDVQRYTLVNKEKNGSLALVWVYTQCRLRGGESPGCGAYYAWGNLIFRNIWLLIFPGSRIRFPGIFLKDSRAEVVFLMKSNQPEFKL